MTDAVTNIVVEALPQFEGYVFPNEAIPSPVWSTLIVIYPYITGLVAGAFIMASLVRVFNVKALTPKTTYKLEISAVDPVGRRSLVVLRVRFGY